MTIYGKNIDGCEINSYVATIGFFDGVHLGHRFLLGCVKEEARKRGLGTIVVTFPESPVRVLHPGNDTLMLSTAEEKVRLLLDTGIDAVAMIPFTLELSKMNAHDFMNHILKDKLEVSVLVMGYDHRFGRSEGGEAVDYEKIGKDLGMEIVRACPFMFNSERGSAEVSSSAIRETLGRGDILAANRSLGYEYSVEGTVVDGHHVGQSIGYPTANLKVNPDKLLPRNGVYAVKVKIADGVEHAGMLNIGRRPTLDNGHDMSVEVHIFDFDGDLYGKCLKLSFLKFIRPERKFSSLDELKRQLTADKQEIEDRILRIKDFLGNS